MDAFRRPGPDYSRPFWKNIFRRVALKFIYARWSEFMTKQVALQFLLFFRREFIRVGGNLSPVEIPKYELS
jgi:hypothetical protein